METATQEQLGGAHESFHKQNGNGPNGHVINEHSTMLVKTSEMESDNSNKEDAKQCEDKKEEEIQMGGVYKNDQSALDQTTKSIDEQSNNVIANVGDDKNVINPNDNEDKCEVKNEQETNKIEIGDKDSKIKELESGNDELADADVKKEGSKTEVDNTVDSSSNHDVINSTNFTDVTNDVNQDGPDTLPTMVSELPESDVPILVTSTNQSTNESNVGQAQNKAECEGSDKSDQKHIESGSESDQKSEPECDIGHKTVEVGDEKKKEPTSTTSSCAPSPAAIVNKDCDIFNFKSGSIKKKDLVPDKVPWNENEIKPIIEATYKTTTWDDIWETKMKTQPLKPLDIELPKPKVNKSVEVSTNKAKQSSPKILKDTSKPPDPTVTKVVKTTRFKITPHVDIPTVEEEKEPSPGRENSEEGSSEHLLPPDAPRIESNLNELTMVESQLKKLGVAAEEMVLKKQLKSLCVDMEDDVDEIILQRRDSNRHTMTVTPHTKLSKAKTLARRNSNTESDGSSGGIAKRLGWLNIFKKRPSTTPPPQTPPPEKEKHEKPATTGAAAPIPKTATTTAKRLAQPPLLAQLNPRVLVIPEHYFHVACCDLHFNASVSVAQPSPPSCQYPRHGIIIIIHFANRF
ncbi:hypothetical protein M8J76_016421 [Diaphorina citri]|nr:hypothetical protein M8J76_016421 [Diaphorina citri]